MKPPSVVRLTPGKRVLFLTKDPELIRRQLRGELDLQMKDLRVEDLLDDINTDAMTPAWTCFDWRPADIARNAYAGLMVDGQRLFHEGVLMGDHAMVARLQAGETLALSEFTRGWDPLTRQIIEAGGLFAFTKA